MSLSDQVVMATSIETLIELLKNLPDYGRVSYVVTAKGDEVKTAFDIVDASALLVSNTLDGKINPDYPQELQPRDRTRASSLLQVNQISKDLRPAQLTDSGLSSHGAPIIGEDNAVESGNGRTMGIIKAYQDGNADRYREYLIDHATEFGIRPEKVESMTAPVLVRRRLTKVDRVQFAKDSNISDLQEMAASEKAFVDADSITPAMMALFNPSESGDLLSRSNDAFIRGFMTQVGATQAAGLVTEDGRPTRQLVDRIQNAIFAKAYKDARLVRMVAEEPDPDMRNVLTALNAAANDFVPMQALSGEAHKQAVTTIVDGIETADSLDKKALAALKDAVDLVRQSKESGQHITDVIAQGDMFSETAPEVKALALFIVANNRSAKRMATAFKLMAQRINDELQHQCQALGDMFGGGDVSLTAEGRDILKEHGITPEFIDEIRTDMQREVVSSLQIVARALADANPKSAAIVNRVIGDIEASEGMGALKLFLSRAFNPNGNILPGIIGEAKKYVSEEELEQLDQLLKRFSYNPQTRWQMNQRSMGSVHEKVLSAMNSAIANSSVSEEKALEWADSFITEEVEEARAGQNGGIDLRKELADIYRLTGGKISTLSKVVHHQGRAYANLNGVVAVNLNDENASALWHELGHHLEYSNPGLLEKARSFLKANVEGDKPSFVNIGGRGKPEWCFRSRLSNIYMAKVYPPASVSNTGKIRQKSPTISKTSATEVFSMALQLYHDKEAAAASLMNGDGLLELLLGVAKELNNAD
ncbi:TPA: hypothetical protein J1A33_003685 [Escherichia coli]|nr:hypothetical protein [Escherichia coli]